MNKDSPQQGEGASIVQAIFNAWHTGFDEIDKTFHEYFDQTCIWKNSGYPDARGPKEAVNLLLQAREKAGMEFIESEIINFIEKPPFVVTERIDRMYRIDRSLISSMNVLGIFEIANSKIVGWREYADPSAFLSNYSQ